MNSNLLTSYLSQTGATPLNLKFLKHKLISLRSKLPHLSLILSLIFFSLFSGSNAYGQSYSGSITFDAQGGVITGTYTFDFVLDCSADGTTADLTVTYVTPPGPPVGLVPQIHLGGGVFEPMSGSNPYTYTFTGLVDCDFSFQFWMAYAGGLYTSPEFLTPSNITLPITLSNFSAVMKDDNTIQLDWKTSTEINSDYFGIERSVDEINWEAIDQIKAATNSNTNISYSYIDEFLHLGRTLNSTLYYRLKLTDLDDSYEYSDIRSVNLAKGNKNNIYIYPIPAKDLINIDLTDIDYQKGEVQISIYNDAGKLVENKNVNSNAIEAIDINHLPSSTYIIVLHQKTEIIYQTRVIKVD